MLYGLTVFSLSHVLLDSLIFRHQKNDVTGETIGKRSSRFTKATVGAFLLVMIWFFSIIIIYTLVIIYGGIDPRRELDTGFYISLSFISAATLVPATLFALFSSRNTKVGLAGSALGLVIFIMLMLTVIPGSSSFLIFQAAGALGMRDNHTSLILYGSTRERGWLRGKRLLELGELKLVCPDYFDLRYARIEFIRKNNHLCVVVSERSKIRANVSGTPSDRYDI